MYKEATRKQTRWSTPKGVLSIEGLWTLSIEDLDKLAVSLQEDYDKSGGKSFIRKRSVKDKDLKLQLDIVVDILQTKVEEAEIAKEKAENKARNNEIFEAIAKKEKSALEGKSIAQLRAMIKED